MIDKLQKHDSKLALVLDYSDCGLFDRPCFALTETHQQDPFDSDTFYYLSFAQCRGKLPSSLRIRDIQEIERSLWASSMINTPRVHYLYIWSQLKNDYYEMKSLMVLPPSIDKLIQYAESAATSEDDIHYLVRRVPVPDATITDIMLGWITAR